MNYYVYLYLHEDGTPYYVGKGVGGRWENPNHNCSVPPRERVSFPVEGVSEEWALFMEMELIDRYGRLDDGTGVLENQTDGGENPPKSKKGQKNRAKSFWDNATEEERKERGKRISEGKKKNAHITAEQVRQRHAAGNYYTEEGKAKQVEVCRRNNAKVAKAVVCVETGEMWDGVKPAARALGVGNETVRRSATLGKTIKFGKLKGYTFRFV
ncbi:hypothetical protein [Synechococcus phage MC09]